MTEPPRLQVSDVPGPTSMDTEDTFLDKLQLLRTAKGLTYRELSDRSHAVAADPGHAHGIGFSPSVLTNWIKHRALPSNTEYVRAWVVACGIEDPEPWAAAHARLLVARRKDAGAAAAATDHTAPPLVDEPTTDESAQQRRPAPRGRRWQVAGLAVSMVLLGFVAADGGAAQAPAKVCGAQQARSAEGYSYTFTPCWGGAEAQLWFRDDKADNRCVRAEIAFRRARGAPNVWAAPQRACPSGESHSYTVSSPPESTGATATILLEQP